MPRRASLLPAYRRDVEIREATDDDWTEI